jgi:hypothetical protein
LAARNREKRNEEKADELAEKMEGRTIWIRSAFNGAARIVFFADCGSRIQQPDRNNVFKPCSIGAVRLQNAVKTDTKAQA